MKYRVTVTVDATISIEVDADSEAEAKEKAMDEAFTPSICHQCARVLEVGDPLEAVEAVPA